MSNELKTPQINPDDLDELIKNLEFHNHHLCTLIEREELTIKEFETGIAAKEAQCQEWQQSLCTLDVEIKRYQEQSNVTGNCCSNYKKTNILLDDHNEFLTKKLEEMKIEEETNEQTRCKVLEQYESVWQDYKQKYEQFPLARKLQEKHQLVLEMSEKVEYIKAEIQSLEEEKKQLLGGCDEDILNLNSFVIKLCKLKKEQCAKQEAYEKLVTETEIIDQATSKLHNVLLSIQKEKIAAMEKENTIQQSEHCDKALNQSDDGHMESTDRCHVLQSSSKNSQSIPEHWIQNNKHVDDPCENVDVRVQQAVNRMEVNHSYNRSAESNLYVGQTLGQSLLPGRNNIQGITPGVQEMDTTPTIEAHNEPQRCFVNAEVTSAGDNRRNSVQSRFTVEVQRNQEQLKKASFASTPRNQFVLGNNVFVPSMLQNVPNSSAQFILQNSGPSRDEQNSKRDGSVEQYMMSTPSAIPQQLQLEKQGTNEHGKDRSFINNSGDNLPGTAMVSGNDSPNVRRQQHVFMGQMSNRPRVMLESPSSIQQFSRNENYNRNKNIFVRREQAVPTIVTGMDHTGLYPNTDSSNKPFEQPNEKGDSLKSHPCSNRASPSYHNSPLTRDSKGPAQNRPHAWRNQNVPPTSPMQYDTTASLPNTSPSWPRKLGTPALGAKHDTCTWPTENSTPTRPVGHTTFAPAQNDSPICPARNDTATWRTETVPTSSGQGARDNSKNLTEERNITKQLQSPMLTDTTNSAYNKKDTVTIRAAVDDWVATYTPTPIESEGNFGKTISPEKTSDTQQSSQHTVPASNEEQYAGDFICTPGRKDEVTISPKTPETRFTFEKHAEALKELNVSPAGPDFISRPMYEYTLASENQTKEHSVQLKPWLNAPFKPGNSSVKRHMDNVQSPPLARLQTEQFHPLDGHPAGTSQSISPSGHQTNLSQAPTSDAFNLAPSQPQPMDSPVKSQSFFGGDFGAEEDNSAIFSMFGSSPQKDNSDSGFSFNFGGNDEGNSALSLF